MVGRSRCEVLSCVDPKNAFHSLGPHTQNKRILWYTPIFW